MICRFKEVEDTTNKVGRKNIFSQRLCVALNTTRNSLKNKNKLYIRKTQI